LLLRFAATLCSSRAKFDDLADAEAEVSARTLRLNSTAERERHPRLGSVGRAGQRLRALHQQVRQRYAARWRCAHRKAPIADRLHSGGSGGGGNGGSGGGNGGSGGGGGNGGNGGSGGGGGGGGAADMSSAATKSGYVSLSAYRAAQLGGIQGGYAYAGFSNTSGSCAAMTQGPCQVQTCSNNTAQVSAGTVSVSGTNVAAMLQPQADGTYGSISSSPTQLFNEGAMLTVNAGGGVVAAFGGSLTAPSRVLITTPAQGAGAITVNRGQGFTATWSGGSAGDVVLYFDGGASRSTQLFCHFAASSGNGTVPASALQLIPAGSGGYAMSTETSSTVRSGDWAVQLTASFNAVWAQDQTIVSGAVTYQ
jgi:hypothetical protein